MDNPEKLRLAADKINQELDELTKELKFRVERIKKLTAIIL